MVILSYCSTHSTRKYFSDMGKTLSFTITHFKFPLLILSIADGQHHILQFSLSLFSPYSIICSTLPLFIYSCIVIIYFLIKYMCIIHKLFYMLKSLLFSFLYKLSESFSHTSSVISLQDPPVSSSS